LLPDFAFAAFRVLGSEDDFLDYYLLNSRLMSMFGSSQEGIYVWRGVCDGSWQKDFDHVDIMTYLSTIMSRKVGILAAIVYAQDPAWDPEGHDVGKGY
jgi:hypothetical protein